MTIESDQADLLKAKLVGRLAKIRRKLVASSVLCRWAYVILQITSVVSGVIVATITAANTGFLGVDHNTAIVLVSGAGSAAAALLGRLRLNDVSRAKEIGRIGIENAILKVETAFMEAASNPSEFAKIYTDLRWRIQDIEYDQVNLVFPSRKEAEHEGKT